MSRWFVEEFLPEFQDKSVLELGAGPGLCGLLAAHKARQVVLTDYMDIVMDLIDTNIKQCNPRPKECQMFAAQLDWDKIDNPDWFEGLDYTNGDQLVEGKFVDLKFDIIIGSDVVYWPQSIVPLCKVLNELFRRQPNIVFYICYIERIKAVHKDLLKNLKEEMKFTVEEIAKNVTKEANPDSYIYKITR